MSLLALAVLWFVLLVTSTGIKTHTWYLLAVGGIGMLQNLAVAAAPRHPTALGLPIELVKTKISTVSGVQQSEVRAIFAEKKVMWTLMELEEKYNYRRGRVRGGWAGRADLVKIRRIFTLIKLVK